MKIKYEMKGKGPAVVSVSGPIDMRNAGEFKATADQLISQGAQIIVLDARSVDFVCSEGLSALVKAHHQLRSSGGFLMLAAPNREVSSLCQALGLNNDFIIASTLDDAKMMAERAGAGDISFMAKEQKEHPHVATAGKNETAFTNKQPHVHEDEITFEQPIVIECEECRSFVRVHASGQFACPSCNTEFTVEKDGTVIF
jgi:anti-sigma B factor antagonist